MRDLTKKMNIVLDIDNTLICAESLKDFPFNAPGIKDKALKFKLHDMEGYYVVFERPFLKEFLEFCNQYFNVIIWTAATKDYAVYIVENIIKKYNVDIQYIFYSYHCDASYQMYNSHKYLDTLFSYFNLDQRLNFNNTIIIDDHPDVIACQPKSCIQIKEFNFHDDDSHRDVELVNTIEMLVQKFDVKT